MSNSTTVPLLAPLADLLAAIERIVDAEAAVSDAPRTPEITPTKPTAASEDFGSFGTEWGVFSVFWFVGGIDRDTYARVSQEGWLGEITTNHNPHVAQVLHPTLRTGVETLVVAAQASLSP